VRSPFRVLSTRLSARTHIPSSRMSVAIHTPIRTHTPTLTSTQSVYALTHTNTQADTQTQSAHTQQGTTDTQSANTQTLTQSRELPKFNINTFFAHTQFASNAQQQADIDELLQTVAMCVSHPQLVCTHVYQLQLCRIQLSEWYRDTDSYGGANNSSDVAVYMCASSSMPVPHAIEYANTHTDTHTGPSTHTDTHTDTHHADVYTQCQSVCGSSRSVRLPADVASCCWDLSPSDATFRLLVCAQAVTEETDLQTVRATIANYDTNTHGSGVGVSVSGNGVCGQTVSGGQSQSDEQSSHKDSMHTYSAHTQPSNNATISIHIAMRQGSVNKPVGTEPLAVGTLTLSIKELQFAIAQTLARTNHHMHTHCAQFATDVCTVKKSIPLYAYRQQAAASSSSSSTEPLEDEEDEEEVVAKVAVTLDLKHLELLLQSSMDEDTAVDETSYAVDDGTIKVQSSKAGSSSSIHQASNVVASTMSPAVGAIASPGAAGANTMTLKERQELAEREMKDALIAALVGAIGDTPADSPTAAGSATEDATGSDKIPKSVSNVSTVSRPGSAGSTAVNANARNSNMISSSGSNVSQLQQQQQQQGGGGSTPHNSVGKSAAMDPAAPTGCGCVIA
jgi:hypothetical protein